MTTYTESGLPLFTSKQIVLLLNNLGLQNNTFLKTAVLCKSTNGLPYTTGTLLALYGANAPAGKAGMYVNYDPASSNADQKVCVGAIATPFLQPIYGCDVVADGSDYFWDGQPFNTVSMLPFLIGNSEAMMFYENAITLANAPAVVTGFRAAFVLQTMATVEANGSMTNVLCVQGKN